MSLDVEIGVKNSRFRAGLEQMRGQAKQFSGDLKGMFLGAFSVGAILSFAEKMREVHKEALRFGTSAESIQRVGKVAKQSDLDFATLAKSINKVTLEAGKAARGGAEQARMFELLGIDAKKFVSMSLDEKVVALSTAFKESQSSGMKTSAMLDLLGNRGGEIIPLLARGPGELAKTMKEATVQTDATVEAMTRLSKQIDMLKGAGGRALGWVIGKMQTFARAVAVTAGVAVNLASGMSKDDALQAAADGLNDADEEEEKQKKAEAKPADDFTNEDKGKKSAALEKEIAELQAKNRAEALSGQAKINELMRQRAELAKKMGEDEVANLEIKKQDLALEKEIDDLKKSQAEKLREAKEKEAEVKEKVALEKMSPDQQRAYLEKKQAALFKQANDMEAAPKLIAAKRAEAARETTAADDAGRFAHDAKAHGKRADHELYEESKGISRRRASQLKDEADKLERESDPVKAVELRTKAEEMQSQIDALKKGDDKSTDPKKTGAKKPDAAKDDDKQSSKFTVTASSLQRVGGGGRAVGTGVDDARRAREKTNQLLQKLVDATTKKDGGSTSVPVEPF